MKSIYPHTKNKKDLKNAVPPANFGVGVYLDYAAATYIEPSVLKKMKPCLSGFFGNASSFHSLGQDSRNAIEKSRQETAKILNCRPAEIIFTGSGTESDNLAILGIARANKQFGNHIIVSKIEHKAVLEPARQLAKEGFKITYLNVEKNGIVDLNEFKKALTKKTILVSIMYANNEIGAIQSIAEISKIIKNFRNSNIEYRNTKQYQNSKFKKQNISNFGFRASDFATVFPLLHTDACQAAGALSLDVKKLGVDAMTLNGSKIYGPKGVGCLYLKNGVKIEPIVFGGGQEKGLRSGTENPALIVGFSEALKFAEKLRVKESRRLTALRDYFIKNIFNSTNGAQLNGDAKKRLPNNINISFSGVDGEALVLHLDRLGVFASSGSACDSRDISPSHVLLALGLKKYLAAGSLRLTLGRKTTKKDIDYVLRILPGIVKNLRKFK